MKVELPLSSLGSSIIFTGPTPTCQASTRVRTTWAALESEPGWPRLPRYESQVEVVGSLDEICGIHQRTHLQKSWQTQPGAFGPSRPDGHPIPGDCWLVMWRYCEDSYIFTTYHDSIAGWVIPYLDSLPAPISSRAVPHGPWASHLGDPRVHGIG